MGGRRLVVVVIGVVAAWGVAEGEARACSCFGTSSLVAPVSDSHPLGAALAFSHQCGGELDAWRATIDGAPAELVGGDLWAGVGTVELEPEPGPGAEVVLYQGCDPTFDAEGCTEDSEVERARFVIGAADETAPAAAELLAIDDEHGEFAEGCEDIGEDLRFSAAIRFPSVEPGSWAVISFRKGNQLVQGESFAIPENGELSASLVVREEEYEGSEVCVEVAAIDASLNASEDRRECTSVPTANERGCAIANGSPWGAAALGLCFVWRRRRR
jgi:hypothetical protein